MFTASLSTTSFSKWILKRCVCYPFTSYHPVVRAESQLHHFGSLHMRPAGCKMLQVTNYGVLGWPCDCLKSNSVARLVRRHSQPAPPSGRACLSPQKTALREWYSCWRFDRACIGCPLLGRQVQLVCVSVRIGRGVLSFPSFLHSTPPFSGRHRT